MATCIDDSTEEEQFTRWRENTITEWTMRLQWYLETFQAAARNESLTSSMLC